jgi:predicted Mrr-cat superfamily restriction endonuclease
MAPIYRAPMRARDRDAPAGAGAEHAIERGLVGTGDTLATSPATIYEAVAAATERHGAKAGRMLHSFTDLPNDTFVWTRTGDGAYRLGRIAGPWRYDNSPAARAVGIHHVRPARWLERPFGEDEVPTAVADTFARGGRNLQRIHDESAERRTAELWEAR